MCKCEFARACTVLIVFNYCKNNYKTIQIYFHFFFIGGVGGMGGGHMMVCDGDSVCW